MFPSKDKLVSFADKLATDLYGRGLRRAIEEMANLILRKLDFEEEDD